MDYSETLRAVSRTFALSIEQLPHELRESVTVAYLLFRVSDCLEDHPGLPAAQKAVLLRLWADVLQGAAAPGALTARISDLDPSDPEVNLAQNAGSLIARTGTLPPDTRRILTKHVHATSLGMARWQEHGPRVADEQELDDYMFEVAGRVGYLLTELFILQAPAMNRRREHLMELGRDFGLALQSVNIIRGLRKDYERGWVFLPEDWLAAAGLTRESFFAPGSVPAALQVINRLADKARRYLDSGLAYIACIPRRHYHLRMFCIWPLLFAVKTLAISRSDPQVIAAERKITRAQVRSIVMISRVLGWSNTALSWYADRLSRP